MIHKFRVSFTELGLLALMALGVIIFVYAAIFGDHGIFRRIQINAEVENLRNEKLLLEEELARLQNLTHRLSDNYLDLDLLDEQARSVLGYLRPDEIIIR